MNICGMNEHMYEGAECEISIDYQDKMRDSREISCVLTVCFEFCPDRLWGRWGIKGHLPVEALESEAMT